MNRFPETLDTQQAYVMNKAYRFNALGRRFEKSDIFDDDGKCDCHLALSPAISQRLYRTWEEAELTVDFETIFACQSHNGTLLALFGLGRIDNLPVLFGEYSIEGKPVPSYGERLATLKARFHAGRWYWRMMLTALVVVLVYLQWPGLSSHWHWHNYVASLYPYPSLRWMLLIATAMLAGGRFYRYQLFFQTPAEPPQHEIVVDAAT